MIKVYECYTMDENGNAKKDWICECWGASTKHPDTKHFFSDWDDKIDMFDIETQIFQWLLYLASKKLFPFHAKELVEYALKNWYRWE